MAITAKRIVAELGNADQLRQYFIRLEKYIRTNFLVQAVASSDLRSSMKTLVLVSRVRYAPRRSCATAESDA
jgi:hypothetical protein